MTSYVALLRGVNVSGKHKISMLQLRERLNKLGFSNVQTYIQSGNVVFQSTLKDKAVLRAKIEEEINSFFGFKIPVLVLSRANLKQLFNACPFEPNIKENSYFTMLFSNPEPTLVNALLKLSFPEEDLKILTNVVYVYCEKGYGSAKLNTNFLEQKLHVNATTRNYKTMLKLLSLSAEF